MRVINDSFGVSLRKPILRRFVCRTGARIRHTFAIHYLRKGGSVFHLQKVLGHSSLEMTRRYANLMTEDLQAVHERVSLLQNAR